MSVVHLHAGAMEHQGVHQDDVALVAAHLVEAAVRGSLDDLVGNRILERRPAGLVARVQHGVQAFGVVVLREVEVKT